MTDGDNNNNNNKDVLSEFFDVPLSGVVYRTRTPLEYSLFCINEERQRQCRVCLSPLLSTNQRWTWTTDFDILKPPFHENDHVIRLNCQWNWSRETGALRPEKIHLKRANFGQVDKLVRDISSLTAVEGRHLRLKLLTILYSGIYC